MVETILFHEFLQKTLHLEFQEDGLLACSPNVTNFPPSGVPGFDPSHFLDEGGRRIYEEPLKHRKDPKTYTAKLPKLKVHCSFEEKVRLFELLDLTGRLGVHRPSEIDGKFALGLF